MRDTTVAVCQYRGSETISFFEKGGGGGRGDKQDAFSLLLGKGAPCNLLIMCPQIN